MSFVSVYIAISNLGERLQAVSLRIIGLESFSKCDIDIVLGGESNLEDNVLKKNLGWGNIV